MAPTNLPLGAASSCLALCCMFLALLSVAAQGATRALVVGGLAGEQAVWEDFSVEIEAWKGALDAVGCETKHFVISPQADASDDASNTRAQVLEVLEEWKAASTPETDLLLVLIGHGSTRKGKYLFQVRGPRLRDSDFATALAEVPRRSLTVVATGPGSAGLLEALAGEDTVIISATSGENQINHTRFGVFLAEALGENPQRPLLEAVRVTDHAVAEHYKERWLARPEYAAVRFGKSQPVEGPFAAEELPPGWPEAWSLAALGTPRPESSAQPPPSPQVVQAPTPTSTNLRPPDAWDFAKLASTTVPYLNLRDATEEEMTWFDTLPPEATDSPHDLVVMFDRTQTKLRDDLSGTSDYHARLYVRKAHNAGRLVDDLAVMRPACGAGCAPGSWRLAHLKTVLPSGQVVEFDMGQVRARLGQADFFVFVPGLADGAIVDFGYEFKVSPMRGIGFQKTALLGTSVPILEKQYTLSTESENTIRLGFFHAPESHFEQSKEPYAFRRSWTWRNLPPWEPEPGIPYWYSEQPRVEMSSYEAWQDFVEWYRFVSADADHGGPAVSEAAARLAQGCQSDREKIQRAYDFVSAMRYIPILVGVNAVRARTPETVLARGYGDCKDKANLLNALLREMGITAWFALVGRGTPGTPDFPNWQFNHAISAVELEGEFLFLDATDEACPFGMLPPGNPHKHALVFRAQNAEFIPLPTWADGYDPLSRAEVRLERAENGGWQGEVLWHPRGLEEYRVRQQARHLSPTQFERAMAAWLHSRWPAARTHRVDASVSPNLSTPPSLSFGFTLPPGARPWLPPLLSPIHGLDLLSRSQPLMPNEGYPLHFEQVITVHGFAPNQSHRPPTLPTQATANGLSCDWQIAEDSTIVTSAVNLDRPQLSPEEWAQFARQAATWEQTAIGEFH